MTPYYVRLFRDAGTVQEKRDIYERAGKIARQQIMKRFQVCSVCFENPSVRELTNRRACKNKCTACMRVYLNGILRRQRFKIAVKRVNLPEHTRVCIDCRRPFPSRMGHNLCIWCVEKTRQDAARRTLRNTPESVRVPHLRVVLNEKYGSDYRSSLTPRAPLSEVDVFRSVR